MDVGKSKLQRKPKSRPRLGSFQMTRLRLAGWNGTGTRIAIVPMGEQGAVGAMVFGNSFMRIAGRARAEELKLRYEKRGLYDWAPRMRDWLIERSYVFYLGLGELYLP